MIDSATIFGWLNSLVIRDKPIRIRGLGEPLVRRRLSLIEDLVKEFNLVIKLCLVKSAENKADALTRIPQDWLRSTHSAVAVSLAFSYIRRKNSSSLNTFSIKRFDSSDNPTI